MDNIIEVNNLSKKFCISLKRSMLYGATDSVKGIFGYYKGSEKLRKNEFWALQDVSFKVNRGESIGVIGENGSGKTTLLRILCGIFPPDKGTINIKGKIGALIAVGAGFHPHMTGRENIYLNGVLMGMKKREIEKKIDEIIDFAGIEEFLDAPVSTYSSGMRVKLGFSIAAHIEPDILLIDEVLSVGDLNFRNKSMKKLAEIRKNCATIFVSHDLASVKKVCQDVLILDKGKSVFYGSTDEALEMYQNNSRRKLFEHEKKTNTRIVDYQNDNLVIQEYGIVDSSGTTINKINVGDDLIVKVRFKSNISIKSPVLCIGILGDDLTKNIIYESTLYSNIKLNQIDADSSYEALIKLDNCMLVPNLYHLNFALMNEFSDEILLWKRGAHNGFENSFIIEGLQMTESVVKSATNWSLLKIS